MMADRLSARAALPALLMLAACDVPEPAQDPAPPPEQTAPDPRPEPSGAGPDLAAYYASLERARLNRGLLRTDGLDAPVDADTLVHNFVRVALHEEHARIGGRITDHGAPALLRRWQEPVRMQVEFGDSVPADQRAQDLRTVTDLAARLSDITGHPISAGQERGNFRVLVLGEQDRRDSAARLRTLVPGIDAETVRLITNLPRSALCLVATFSRGARDVYTDAVAVIRAEHPDLTRRSCFHEELAQGLGLPNDDDDVRPSLFNDREEYALLTRHDEMLLQILYDARLSPGMTEAEARPIVARIAEELTGPRI